MALGVVVLSDMILYVHVSRLGSGVFCVCFSFVCDATTVPLGQKIDVCNKRSSPLRMVRRGLRCSLDEHALGCLQTVGLLFSALCWTN